MEKQELIILESVSVCRGTRKKNIFFYQMHLCLYEMGPGLPQKHSLLCSGFSPALSKAEHPRTRRSHLQKVREKTVRSYADGLCLSRPVGRQVGRASDLCFWPSYAAIFKNLAAIISGTAGKALHDATGPVQPNSTPEKTAGPWLDFGDPRPLGIP